MRNGPNNNKRMRSRNNNNNNSNNNNRRGQNPMTRVFESNGPDIKIRGTASHVAEKYVQLARDARSSGDPVAAENYYQHAEHYFRLIAAAQEQFRQNQPQQQQPMMPRNDSDALDDNGDDGDSYSNFGAEPGFAPGHQQQQPQFQPREQQPFPREQQQPREQHFRDRDHRPQPQPSVQPAESEPVDRLPSFITGGAQPQANGNGAEASGNPSGERFGHRRRRRPPGPRPEGQSAQPPAEDFSAGE
ncbi:MAG: DUF4167 domain-containing protein [Afipia sp.]|jgi:hypothetical protein|nr:DUF4167 domain-containing protein [Afipia sp.]MCR6733909.1 DUF4167 domain-containing protein [Afipia sp.]